MTKRDTGSSDAGYRHTVEISSHTVWLYSRFTLSLRAIEELLAARKSVATYETVRQWCLTFGQASADEVRWCQPRQGNKKLRSNEATHKEMLPGVEHRRHRYLNNRAEVPHQPTRQQERPIAGSSRRAKRNVFSLPTPNVLRTRCHRRNASAYRNVRAEAFKTWRQVTCAQRPQQAVTGWLS